MFPITRNAATLAFFLICLGAPTLGGCTNTSSSIANGIAETRALAEKGDREAETRLANLYSTGEGQPFLPRDANAAINWWTKAAEQGQAEAAFHLANAYLFGLGGVVESKTEGLKWLHTAADNGSANAQWILGSFYAKGKNVSQNSLEAVKWLRKSAEQGFANAECDLGAAYATGSGVPQDYEQALMWLRKAADHNLPLAQFNLGQMYHSGKGIPKNHVTAVKFWHQAADRGNASAQVKLADAYANGDGVTKDLGRAYMWYDIALWSDETATRTKYISAAQAQLKGLMTEQELSKAKSLASDWKVKWAERSHIVTDASPNLP